MMADKDAAPDSASGCNSATASAQAVTVPAPEIVAELGKSGLAREAQAFLAAVAAGELGTWTRAWSPFRCLYGFVEWTGSLAAFPVWAGATGPNLKPTHAASPWQDEPETYRRIAALTGRPGFFPQDQIANNWALAVLDFAAHPAAAGTDLLTALQAGQLAAVEAGLVTTWPAGAGAGFAARYTAALALFPANPAPAGQPLALTLRLGTQVTFPLTGTDQDGLPFTPPDALVSDNPAIAPVSLSGGSATIAGLALGNTLVHGADLSIAVTVEASSLAHLVADLAHTVVTKLATGIRMAGIAAMTSALLAPAQLAPTTTVQAGRFQPVPTGSNRLEPVAPAVFAGATFCFDRDLRAIPIAQCGTAGSRR